MSENLEDVITIAGFGIIISLFIIAIGYLLCIASRASIEKKYLEAQGSEQKR